MVRKNKGRQKIEMEKMKNETNLQVTFSKRRYGLFKKASELCTLCSAEIAIIVHSPGGKVFSFGHPNVDVVIARFLRPHHHQHNNMQFREANRNNIVQNLNDHLSQVTTEFEAEKKKNGDLKQKRKDSKMPGMWWEDPVETLDLSQLTKLKCVLENVKKTVANKTSRLLQATGHAHNFYAGSSSNAAAFGISAATNIKTEFFDNDIIKTELDLFNHGRMVSMNTFNHNHNMIVPYNHATNVGNNGNNTEGFVPNHNMIVPYNHATPVGNNGNNTEGFVPQRNMIVPYQTPPFGNSGNNAEGFVPRHNMILPHHTSPFGNSANNAEGFVPQHNMNYMPEFNQNQIQYFKQEDSSEYAYDPRHFGRH